ncbi:sensor histidine kinase [Lachnospiraceae bacterium 48-42]|jgi:Signal transduction histidine kinase
MKRLIRQTWYWILLLFTTNIVFIFATWIIRREALQYMSLFLLLFTLLVLAAGLSAEVYRRRKEKATFGDFFENPDEKAQERLLEHFDNNETVRELCTRFLSEQSLVNEKAVELSEYREYIEAWVHEIKTPLSLLTLVCNNHRDEISPYVYARMNYIQHQLNEDVERILYYARLQAEHSDIKFTHFRLDECVGEALSEYRPFINEKKILLTEELLSLEIASDRKIVLFILSQLFSNAVKYSDSIAGRISIAMRQTDDKIYLAIHNNGKGVPTEDAPFVFDKGFTGNYPNRQKATGMGLYLVRKYAEKLCIEVHLTSRLPFESGFGIELIFTL